FLRVVLPAPCSTLFPYTTLFRSKDKGGEPKSDVRIVTEAEFRADDEGYADPTEHAHIWTVAAGMPGDEPAKARQVTSGEFDENRSEEHTSELQSRFDLVCRLLLE